MPNKYFEILPSNVLRYWIIGIHAAVFLVILSLSLEGFIKLSFLGLVGLSYFFVKNKKNQIQSIEYVKENMWKLSTLQGERIPATLLKRNYISDFLLILRFDSKDVGVLLLLSHQLSPQNWRYLQMIVRN